MLVLVLVVSNIVCLELQAGGGEKALIGKGPGTAQGQGKKNGKGKGEGGHLLPVLVGLST